MPAEQPLAGKATFHQTPGIHIPVRAGRAASGSIRSDPATEWLTAGRVGVDHTEGSIKCRLWR